MSATPARSNDEDAGGKHALGAIELLGPASALVVPADPFGSGCLDQVGGVGPRAIPLDIALPLRDSIACGGTVLCWISDDPIAPGRLHLDHVIPYSYGGATSSANLLPADALANCSRGNSLELLRERGIGWRWALDEQGRSVRVPDSSQRLVRVSTPEGCVYWSVPKFNVRELGIGIAGSAAVAVALEGAMQWRRSELRPDALAEEAAKAAAGYSARYSAKVGVKALAPRAINLVGPRGVQVLGRFAGPVGFVAAIYGTEAVVQGFALARGQVTPAKAARSFALAPVGVVKETADLVVQGYKLLRPKYREIRKSQERWQSINFVRDLRRPDPLEAWGPVPDEPANASPCDGSGGLATDQRGPKLEVVRAGHHASPPEAMSWGIEMGALTIDSLVNEALLAELGQGLDGIADRVSSS